MEAKDITANRHHGEYVGNYDLEEIALVKGDCGSSVRLRGGYIDISDAASALTGSEVISGIIFTRLQTSAYEPEFFAGLVSLYSSNSFDETLSVLYNGFFNRYQLTYGTGEVFLPFSTSDLNEVHMVYFSVNQVTGEMILDINAGDYRESSVAPVELPNPNFSGGTIGSTFSGSVDHEFNWEGWLDEVAFFDRELTSSELSDIYDECMETVGWI